MTRPAENRKRIVRIRAVEQRLAQTELATAQRAARQIGAIIDRLVTLDRENTIVSGLADGRSLAAQSETAMRLQYARQLTAEPMASALKQVAYRQLKSNQAQIKLEGASRLFEKSERIYAAHAAQRADAVRCAWYPRKPGATP